MTTKKKKSQGMKLFLMILPFLILCFLFSYFPLHGWIYALYDYKAPLKLSQCQFVGLKWFKTLFSNKTQVMQLIQVMKNTFAMSLLGIATSFLPVLFAVFLNALQPALVRHDDMALLLRHSGDCLCENADGRGAEDTVLPHRRAVLCCLGVPALDGGLLLAGYFSGKPNLLV